MQVFISSLIRDWHDVRDAAASAVTALGHRAVRAEDFQASPDSPQAACLAGVRQSDVMVLLLGAEYGPTQSSGLSATHEEYREARDVRPVIVFIAEGMNPEPHQAAFIEEVRGWEHGHYTGHFHDAADLRDKVIRALHDYTLANESAPLDEDELIKRASALVPNSRSTAGTELIVVVAGGPRRAVLRPAELEADDLRRFLMAEALTGDDAVLSTSAGTRVELGGDALQLVQDNGTGLVSLDEAGSVIVVQPAMENHGSAMALASIIEEDVTERIARAIRFCARVLGLVDGAKRLSHVVPVAALRGAGYLPWRTRAEQQRSPNAATLSMGGVDLIVVELSPPVRRRAALRHNTQQLAEDLTVRLRREVVR